MEDPGLDLGGERSPHHAVSPKGRFRARPAGGTAYLSVTDSLLAVGSRDALDMPHLTVTLPTPPGPAQRRKLRKGRRHKERSVTEATPFTGLTGNVLFLSAACSCEQPWGGSVLGRHRGLGRLPATSAGEVGSVECPPPWVTGLGQAGYLSLFLTP